jgi:hypothetical protein
MKKPNPGSEEATNAGCTCAVMDNGHGYGSGYPGPNGEPLFYISGDCPLHGKPEVELWALVVVVALSALIGCEKPEIATESPTEAMNRFTVTYCGRFPTRGMGETVESRSIYRLKDKETGREYLMVPGCGAACGEKAGERQSSLQD